ncbi:MAG: hypothetical protein RL017_449, partial [Pseudomonadota bacterium]
IITDKEYYKNLANIILNNYSLPTATDESN